MSQQNICGRRMATRGRLANPLVVEVLPVVELDNLGNRKELAKAQLTEVRVGAAEDPVHGHSVLQKASTEGDDYGS